MISLNIKYAITKFSLYQHERHKILVCLAYYFSGNYVILIIPKYRTALFFLNVKEFIQWLSLVLLWSKCTSRPFSMER